MGNKKLLSLASDVDNVVVNSLLGIAIGDALGVPVEFVGRDFLRKYPITKEQKEQS